MVVGNRKECVGLRRIKQPYAHCPKPVTYTTTVLYPQMDSSGADNGESSCEQVQQSPQKSETETTNDRAEMPLDKSRWHNWQSDKKNLQERISHIFNTNIFSDVSFLVGPSKVRVPAHKLVLSIGSAVFDALFNGPLATFSDVVEIPDVEPDAFLTLLKFLYTDKKDVGPDTVTATLYAAKKYDVTPLKEHCIEFLENNLHLDNAFIVLTQAKLFDEPSLTSKSLKFIDKHASVAFGSDGFTDIDHENLCLILERDTLKISEEKLFQAVVKWAEAECKRQDISNTPENLRSVIGRAWSLIRFPLMKMEQFAVNVVQSGLVKDSEVVQMFMYYAVNPKPEVQFSKKSRCGFNEDLFVITRFFGVGIPSGCSGNNNYKLGLTVDRRIFVAGFGLYGSINHPAEYGVKLKINRADSIKYSWDANTSFSSDGSNKVFFVPLEKSVELVPNTSYTVTAELLGPHYFYGIRGISEVRFNVPGFERVTFKFGQSFYSGNSISDGQIPAIYFHM